MDQFLEYISLSENELNRFLHEPSGGQLQRLVIARPAAGSSFHRGGHFYLYRSLDKPVSALDVFYTGADTEPNRGSKAKLPHDHDVYLQ